MASYNNREYALSRIYVAFRLSNLFAALRRQHALSAKPLEANSLIESGRPDLAASILGDLLAVDSDNAEAWYKQGNVLKNLNRPMEALTSYQRAIELRPRYTAALCNRGAVMLALGRAQEALNEFQKAVAIDQNDPIAHYNLATANHSLNQSATAHESYAKAIALNPAYVEPHFARGMLHEQSASWQEALNDYDRVLTLNPGFGQADFRLANVLVQLKRWEDALTSYDRAVASDPDHAIAHLHRGNVLRHLQKWDDALSSYNRSIALAPDQVDGYFNRGVLFEQLKQFPEAKASFDRAIAIRPDFAPAQYNRALVQLSTGDFVSGFENYEWRWKNRGTPLDPARLHGAAPVWSGHESLEGKTILVFSEQGLGDTLQFCRYTKLLASLGAKVILEVQQPLIVLLAHIEGASVVVPRGGVVPSFDYKCALLSLPLAFKTTPETIPSESKYLHVDPARIARWEARLGPRSRPRIGLAWSGNAQYPNDSERSMPLATLVAHLPRGFDYFCLQTDIRARDRETLDANPFIADLSSDFIETAAFCECLDLVISVCTSMAHLAGSLGRPVWILLAHRADWRWQEDREDSPWYPSARLYRQEKIGDWDSVAERVGVELRRAFEKA
jgi:tetratricopeptide (TPR) repeat protein